MIKCLTVNAFFNYNSIQIKHCPRAKRVSVQRLLPSVPSYTLQRVMFTKLICVVSFVLHISCFLCMLGDNGKEETVQDIVFLIY